MKKQKILIVAVCIAVVIIYSIINIIKDINSEISYSDILINENDNEETIENINIIKIHIAGEVNNVGIIELNEGDRIADAIEKAGGITANANLKNVNLAYVLEDGQKLYIPNLEEKDNIEYIINENGENIIESTTSGTTSKKININKATQEQLETLPGVGPSLSKKILDYKEQNGKFKSIEELKNVSGVGEKKYDALKDYIEAK